MPDQSQTKEYRMRRIALFMIILALCAVTMVYASDWAQFLGLTANSISPEKIINKNWNSNPPKMLWKIKMSDGGYAGPSVAGNKVFIIDHIGAQDVVKALDIRTGKELWNFSYPDAEKANYGFARSTPVFNSDRVYITGRFGQIFCLNATNGKKIWMRDTLTDFGGKMPTWQYAASPLIDGNKLIFCPGGNNASMVALDKTTGKTLWKGGGSDLASYATPVIATINGTRQYVVFTGISVIGVDALKGTLLWSHTWRSGYDINGASCIVTGNSVFITSGYGHGCALLQIVKNKVNVVWETKDMQCRFGSPILINGNYYGVGEPGDLVCLDPKTGKSVWRQPGFEFGSIIAADGTLLVLGGQSGNLHMAKITTAGYQELGKFTPLGGQSWTAPILSNGNLIIRNKSTLACFSLK